MFLTKINLKQFWLKKIIQVTDSIPWVRCASGNVSQTSLLSKIFTSLSVHKFIPIQEFCSLYQFHPELSILWQISVFFFDSISDSTLPSKEMIFSSTFFLSNICIFLPSLFIIHMYFLQKKIIFISTFLSKIFISLPSLFRIHTYFLQKKMIFSSTFLSNICISLPSLECRRIGRASVLRLQMS